MKKILTIALALFGYTFGMAQECEIPMSVLLQEGVVNVPESAAQVLDNQLRRIALKSGVNTQIEFSQFALTAHVDQLDRYLTNTVPAKVVNQFGVTLYIADVLDQKKFSSTYIEIKGVGDNETKSVTNAFRQLNASNASIQSFVKKGREEIINYYNTQYPNLLKEAQRLVSLQQYSKALAICASVPVCSKGGDAASQLGEEIYGRQLNYINQQIINEAQAIWAAGQDDDAAMEAAELLAGVDPEAKCYAQAQALLKEIKQQRRSDIDWEARDKYKLQMGLEKNRIEAWRAVGVAYGNHQKPTTTNLTWLR